MDNPPGSSKFGWSMAIIVSTIPPSMLLWPELSKVEHCLSTPRLSQLTVMCSVAILLLMAIRISGKWYFLQKAAGLYAAMVTVMICSLKWSSDGNFVSYGEVAQSIWLAAFPIAIILCCWGAITEVVVYKWDYVPKREHRVAYIVSMYLLLGVYSGITVVCCRNPELTMWMFKH